MKCSIQGFIFPHSLKLGQMESKRGQQASKTHVETQTHWILFISQIYYVHIMPSLLDNLILELILCK